MPKIEPDYDDPSVAARFRVEVWPPEHQRRQIGNDYLCCMVFVDEYSRIVWTCAALRRFVGQDIENLRDWAKRIEISPL